MFKFIKYLSFTLFFSVCLIFATDAMAQFGPGKPGGGGPGAPPAVPVDGGLSILLAAGGAYGLKKLRDKKKSKEL